MSAVKTLGRNPIGSETLLTPEHLSILLHYTSLPLPSPPDGVSLPRLAPSSPTALEALRVLANLLVLHAVGRDKFAEMGGAQAIARALAGKNTEGAMEEGGEGAERVFLLGRIGFLVTVDRPEAVELMVDKEDLVSSLVFVSAAILEKRTR